MTTNSKVPKNCIIHPRRKAYVIRTSGQGACLECHLVMRIKYYEKLLVSLENQTLSFGIKLENDKFELEKLRARYARKR